MQVLSGDHSQGWGAQTAASQSSEIDIAEGAPKYTIDDQQFGIFLASSILLRRHGSGKIVFLYGTSNAGKTTLCKKITSKYSHVILDGIDAAMDRHYLKIVRDIEEFKKYFLHRYSSISKCVQEEDIPRFLAGKKVKFKLHSTLSEQQEAQQSSSYVSIIEELFFSAFHRDCANHDLFERSLWLSDQGKDVLIDSVDCNDFISYKLSKSFHCPLLVTLVHCSFAKLAQHKEIRTQQALQQRLEHEARFGTYPFLQYTDFFKPRTDPTETVFHCLDKETAIQIYEKHLQEELTHRPIPGITSDEIEMRRAFELDVLVSRLGLSSQNEVQLTIRSYFDIEVDTGKGSQNLDKLITFLNG